MTFCRIYAGVSNFVRCFCSKNVSDYKNGKQSARILKVLNDSNPEELSKYNVSLVHIQKLVNWKSQRGPFKNFNDILGIEGFEENTLKEICQSITCSYDARDVQSPQARISKRIKNLVTPEMHIKTLSTLKSVVAIHLEPIGIGWARLDKQNNAVTSWTCDDFGSLPPKVIPVDTFNLAINILRKTPPGDVYIFETINNLAPQAQAKQTSLATYNQKIELISMLLALINTSVIHNTSLQKLGDDDRLQTIDNRVFFLRSNIPARLFGTLIGSERVSSVTAINRLLKADLLDSHLPYTPVLFDGTLKKTFFNQTSTKKELLAQALMLGVSFMDLYIRKKLQSCDALNFNNRKRKTS